MSDPSVSAWLLTQGALGLICLFLGFLLFRADRRESNKNVEIQNLRQQIFAAIEARIALGLTCAQTIEANTRTSQAVADRFTTLINLVETLQDEVKRLKMGRSR